MDIPVMAGPPNLDAGAFGDGSQRWDTNDRKAYHPECVPNGFVVVLRWNDAKGAWDQVR